MESDLQPRSIKMKSSDDNQDDSEDIYQLETENSDESSLSKPKSSPQQTPIGKSKNAFKRSDKDVPKTTKIFNSDTTQFMNKNILERNDNSIDDDDSSKSSGIQELSDHNDEINESIQRKNMYIKELLSDLQVLDEENKSLRNEVFRLKDKLSEATQHIQEQTISINNANTEKIFHMEEINNLKNVQSVLQSQLESFMSSNKSNETQMDEFVQQMDLRINEWQSILENKDSEIKTLNDEIFQLQQTLSSINQRDPDYFNDVIKYRDEQITDLQNKLSEATNELIKSTQIIEKLKKEGDSSKMAISLDNIGETDTIERLKVQLYKTKSENTDLEDCLKLKEVELAEALGVVNNFQSNIEVKDMMQINKKHKQQIKIRDDQIKNLIAENNNYVKLIDQIQLENAIMRKKLNLPPEQIISTNNILSKYTKLKKELSSAIKKQHSMDEQNITLKIRLRQKEKCIKKLYSYIKNQGIAIPEHFLSVILTEEPSSAFEAPDNNTTDEIEFQRVENNIEENDSNISDNDAVNKNIVNEDKSALKKYNSRLLVENEALKKGLDEIFETLQQKVADSSLEISAECMERLVKILDSKHMSGWFHPAMRILLDLKTDKGNQDSLKYMLKEAKKDMVTILDLLSKESQKNDNLEQKFLDMQKSAFKDTNKVKIEDSKTNDWSINRSDCVRSELAEDYLQTANNSYTSALHENLKNFQKQFEVLYDSMTEIFAQNSSDQNKWSALEENYKKEIMELKLSLESYNMPPNGDNEKRDKIYFERKCKYLEEALKFLRNDHKNIKSEMYQYKIECYEKLKYYEIELQKMMFHAVNLRNTMRKSVPLDIFVKQNIKLNEYELKYRLILNEIQKSSETLNLNMDENRNLKKSDLSKDNDQKNNESNPTLEELKAQVKRLECDNLNLQKNQNDLIDKVYSSWINNEDSVNETKLQDLNVKIELLKSENLQLNSKLNIMSVQVNYFEHNKLENDLEMNILRHQILDLQSNNDNKAIIARLNGEILISHMHISEMNNKRESLLQDLEKEQRKCKKMNETITEKDIQFDNYVSRTNLKINFLSTVLQIMREQYQGSLPLAVLENIQNSQREVANKLNNVRQIEDDLNKMKCKHEENVLKDLMKKIEDDSCIHNQEGSQCPHHIKLELNESMWNREKRILKEQSEHFKASNKQLEDKIASLEECLIILTFGFGKSVDSKVNLNNKDSSSMFNIKRTMSMVELTDIDDEDDVRCQNTDKPTPMPRKIVNKCSPQHKANDSDKSIVDIDNLPGSPIKTDKRSQEVVIQTDSILLNTVECQTDFVEKTVAQINVADNVNDVLEHKLQQALSLANERAEKIITMQLEIFSCTSKINMLEETLKDRDDRIEELNGKVEKYSKSSNSKGNEEYEKEIEKLNLFLNNLKTLETDKDAEIEEYKELLKNEKIEHNKTSSLAQKQIADMMTKMEALEREHDDLKNLMNKPSHIEAYNVSMEKCRKQIIELEDKCFQLQKDFDSEHAALSSSKSECERWKSLAAERYSSLESLNRRLEEKYSDEVNSYKLETSHWLSELATSKEEITELKMYLNDHKNAAVKQIVDRNISIEKLHAANSNLKQQILNLHSVISANDPSFDLGAIIEMEEEFVFDGEDSLKLLNNDGELIANNKLSKNWPENVIERLRREKQIFGKQNAILRKQIKIMNARERRTRLELQNTKSQMSRKHIPGSLIKTFSQDDNYLLLKKIAALESQLSDKSSVNFESDTFKVTQIALWEKQKRWQENSERWKQRYVEKSAELEKLKKNFDSCRILMQRLEREKRNLDSRLSKYSREGFTPSTITGECDGHLEMLLQDKERLEKEVQSLKLKLESNIKHNSLIEKLEMQQRRITTLELAERGKDVLVNEYERLLAQNSLLAKQNVKLETELLENQLSNIGRRLEPDGSDGESPCCRRVKQQNAHLESYIKLMKEENSQLIAKNIENATFCNQSVNTGTSSQVKRLSELEKTVLTLRGLVGKLQSENKRLHNLNTKYKIQYEEKHHDKDKEKMEVEIERLMKIINEKDELLSKAKDLLKKAVEKEKQLIREIEELREKCRQL